jgi:hypothetical protein
MPTYEYKCLTCGQVREVYAHVDEQDEKWPDCCGVRMDYHWQALRHTKPFAEFDCPHVLGPNREPLRITSLQQLRRVERDYGVNFPAYGSSMLKNADTGWDSETTWLDDEGHMHRD